MTKTCLLRSRAGRNHIANLDVTVGHNDAVNQQLDQLPFLRKRCRGQSVLHPSAEILDATATPASSCRRSTCALQLSLLLGESLGAALQVLPAAAILLERDDTRKIGLGEALQLLLKTSLSTAEALAACLEFLR